jgi:hypothetical protein
MDVTQRSTDIASAEVSSPAIRRRYRSLAACLVAEVPVFVPVFNNPTFAETMLQQLQARGIRNIFFVDNASTYPGMLAFLDRAERHATIIQLAENRGPHDLIASDTNFACLPDIFCITDPDLAFNPAMPADFLFDLLDLTNRLGVGKAGLALDLADRSTMNQEKFTFAGQQFHIWEWEEQFWRQQIGTLADGSPVYKANVDTTFALYNKKHFRRETFYDAVRVAGSYTCRHLPWYRNTSVPADEDRFYRATQKFSYHMR